MLGQGFKRCVGATANLALPLAALIGIAMPQSARASDWGCQVILCLATPGSPTTYPACVPPITKLWQHLATGGVFPTCLGVGIRSRASKHGYTVTITRTDGVTSRYQLDTRYQSVTPQ
nr:hypothetical protein [Sphingomonas carotinifaciens]